LKLKNDEVLSNFAYNLSLRRYSTVFLFSDTQIKMESFLEAGTDG